MRRQQEACAFPTWSCLTCTRSSGLFLRHLHVNTCHIGSVDWTKHCSKFPIYKTEAANTSLPLYCEVSKFRLILESKGKDSKSDKHNPFTRLWGRYGSKSIAKYWNLINNTDLRSHPSTWKIKWGWLTEKHLTPPKLKNCKSDRTCWEAVWGGSEERRQNESGLFWLEIILLEEYTRKIFKYRYINMSIITNVCMYVCTYIYDYCKEK